VIADHLPIYGLEDLGFVGRGEGGPFIAERNTAPGGKLPLSTNGGGLSYCIPACTACTPCRRASVRCAASPPPRCRVRKSRSAMASAACSPPPARSSCPTSRPRRLGLAREQGAGGAEELFLPQAGPDGNPSTLVTAGGDLRPKIALGGQWGR
jgi:Thiolase C-terminal domain-like